MEIKMLIWGYICAIFFSEDSSGKCHCFQNVGKMWWTGEYYLWIQCRLCYIQNVNYHSIKPKCISSVLLQNTSCKTWKTWHIYMYIYRQEGYQSINMRGQISISVISVVSICSTSAMARGTELPCRYAFPPFCLIGRCLARVQQDSAEMVLVTPVWQTQP